MRNKTKNKLGKGELENQGEETSHHHLNIVASLRYLKTLPIITGELVLLTATHLQDLCAGLALLACIVLNHPLVPAKGQGVLVHHGEGEVSVVVVSHPPSLVCLVS